LERQVEVLTSRRRLGAGDDLKPYEAAENSLLQAAKKIRRPGARFS
jgi:hypothetical protein